MHRIHPGCVNVPAVEGEDVEQAPSSSLCFAKDNIGHHFGATTEMVGTPWYNGREETAPNIAV